MFLIASILSRAMRITTKQGHHLGYQFCSSSRVPQCHRVRLLQRQLGRSFSVGAYRQAADELDFRAEDGTFVPGQRIEARLEQRSLPKDLDVSKARRSERQSPLKIRHLASSPAQKRKADASQGPTTVQVARLSNARPQVVFSLIQPTGIPHLGNYLGALRLWKDLQDEKANSRIKTHKLIFGIADLHSLTGNQSPQERRQHIRETFAALLAIGLKPDVSALFVQSQIRTAPELMWYLSTVASFGALSRMTQWKDKLGVSDTQSIDNLSESARDKLKLGLFSYPVLQAADILSAQADLVPVGEDQLQHIELARRIARSFNSAHAHPGQPLFKAPTALVSPAKRVMSLTDPSRKMSKSDPNENSRILITDSSETIRKKIMSAKTDSLPGVTYDRNERAGVSNLIEILVHTTRSTRSFEETAADFQTLKELKGAVADAVVKEFAGCGDRFADIMRPDNPELELAKHGGKRIVSGFIGTTLQRVRHELGLNWYPAPFDEK